jgi:NodT family efflux transporter outer membrane factor (OMF) lipoprotein
MYNPWLYLTINGANKMKENNKILCSGRFQKHFFEISNKTLFGLFCFFILLPVSCTTLGPDFKTPDAQVSKEWTDAEESVVSNESMDHSQWWQVFSDPILNNLIDKAAQQNLSLQIAGLRIIEARAVLGIAIGQQYPQSQQLSGGYTISKSSENTPPQSNISGIDTRSNIGDIGFSAAWELDFWGKFRRGVESADADLSATFANYDDLLVMLTAEVATTYMVIQTIEQRLAYANSNVILQQRGLDIATAQFEGGRTTELDVQQARSLLLNTKALIPELEIGLRQAKNGLSILLGVPTGELRNYLDKSKPSNIQKVGMPIVPTTVALGIPADLIRRRPDIRYAEFQVASQGARIGVAEAALYPQFALAGSIGFAADDKSLLSSDSLLGFFTPFTFKWDILNYGRVKNDIRVQDARFQQMVVQYQNKVLEATGEVEDGLIGFLRSQTREKFLNDAEKASIRATELSLLHYTEGLSDYTRVLSSQQVLVEQQDSLVKTKGDVVRYLISVYKALGGGWQIKAGKNIVPSETIEIMKERTDWGNLLDTVSHPKEPEIPGKEADLFNKPSW